MGGKLSDPTYLRENSLIGKVALVTGGASGIGREIARALAISGADIGLLDITPDELAVTAKLVRDVGSKAVTLDGDVTDEQQVIMAVSECIESFGGIDILINNAGRSLHCPPEQLSLAQWHELMDVNVTGYFLCAREVGRHLIERGSGGCIVNISSIGASSSLGRGSFVYGIAKAAINQMTRELAVEWARYGVRVNAVQPCQVRTPALERLLAGGQFDSSGLESKFLSGIPLGRLAEASDVAGLVAFLCTGSASMVTGACIPVDGGNLALNAGGTIAQS
jgi:gluconate 5-dehydrogenase